MAGAMSDECRMHDSVTQCISRQMNRLRIATALVVIRDKPADQSAREFATSLQIFHRDRDKRWKADYDRLKHEVLLLRQQQLLHTKTTVAATAHDRAIYDSPSISSCSSFGENREMTIYRTPHRQMALLTPPNSQLSSYKSPASSTGVSTNVESGGNTDQTEFLRAFFYLEHQMRIQPTAYDTGDRMLENEVIRQSILVVVRHVERSLVVESTIYFPQCLESLRLCVRLLDRHSRWSQTLRETFAQLAEKWIQSVLDVSEPRQQVMKPFALLQVMADSKGLAPRLVESLLKKVAQCQQKLIEWQGARNELVPDQLITSFADASYLFALLETAIARLAPIERNRFLSVPSQLPDVHPHVSLHFPLFALSLMRLQSRLAQTTAGEAINNNSSSID